jgi:hypothetical protein
MEESKVNIDRETGIITINIPKFTKVQSAFAKYWQLLHEMPFEREGGHPSWKGNGKKLIGEIQEIRKTMTDTEREEFDKKVNPFYLLILKTDL